MTLPRPPSHPCGDSNKQDKPWRGQQSPRAVPTTVPRWRHHEHLALGSLPVGIWGSLLAVAPGAGTVPERTGSAPGRACRPDWGPFLGLHCVLPSLLLSTCLARGAVSILSTPPAPPAPACWPSPADSTAPSCTPTSCSPESGLLRRGPCPQSPLLPAAPTAPQVPEQAGAQDPCSPQTLPSCSLRGRANPPAPTRAPAGAPSGGSEGTVGARGVLPHVPLAFCPCALLTCTHVHHARTTSSPWSRALLPPNAAPRPEV